jgi:hypothetical protein
MSNTRNVRLVLKQTAVPGKTPTGTTGYEENLIRQGELALNTHDRKLFSFDGNEIFQLNTQFTGGTVSNLTIASGFTLTQGANNGYVLVSDSQGNGSWQDISVGTSAIYSEIKNFTENTPITITHNLNTTDVLVQIIDTVSNESIYGGIDNYQSNSVDVTLTQSLANVKVVVAGGSFAGLGENVAGNHNELSGIQGGQNNEYYHLSLNQYDNLALKNTNNSFTTSQYINGSVSATTFFSGNTELGSILNNYATNLGDGTNIFKQKVGAELQFSSISGGTGIQIQNGDTIVVSQSTVERNNFISASEASLLNSSTRSFFTTNGLTLVTFAGGNADNQICSFQFNVPEDYVSGGTFSLTYTTNTTSGNVKFVFIISTIDDGSNLSGVGETGLSVVAPGQTSFERATTSLVTPITSTFSPGKSIIVRINRPGNDAQDTANNINAHIFGLNFYYTART